MRWGAGWEGLLSRFLEVVAAPQRRADTALAEKDDNSDNYADDGWGEDNNNLDLQAVINTMNLK
jgi:hypothetical protein